MFCIIDKYLLKSYWKKGGSLSTRKLQEAKQLPSTSINH